MFTKLKLGWPVVTKYYTILIIFHHLFLSQGRSTGASDRVVAVQSLEIFGGGKLMAEYDDGESFNNPAVTVNATVSFTLDDLDWILECSDIAPGFLEISKMLVNRLVTFPSKITSISILN